MRKISRNLLVFYVTIKGGMDNGPGNMPNPICHSAECHDAEKGWLSHSHVIPEIIKLTLFD